MKRRGVPATDGWGGSVEHLFGVLREAGDGITVTDATGRLVFVNRSAAKLMGFGDPAEVMMLAGNDVLANFELLDELGQPMAVDRLPSRRALTAQGPHEALLRFRVRATGVERWSLVRSVAIRDPDSSSPLVVNTFQDVSALKESEDRLQLLADVGAILGRSVDYQETLNELARIMVQRLADWCVIDLLEPGSGIRRVAVAHADAAKVRLAEEVQARYPSDPAAGGIGTVIASGSPLLLPVITDEELIAAATDEEHADALRELGLRSALLVPLQARGQTLGALSLIRSDLSRAFAETELPLVQEVARRAGTAIDNARLLNEATEALQLRDDFLAVASHDMRTPLAAVLGYIQLARRRLARAETEDEKLHEYLASAERMTERLTGLVGDLMDISLLRSGQAVPLMEEALELRRLVAETVGERHELHPERIFEIEPGADPITVIGDRRRLQRVLDNLLDNAVKFSSDADPITIEVRAADGTARIAVTDRGCGIPRQDLPLIFERYRRGSNAVGVQGTGLGLAGSREIVRQMGGEITVTSREGEGSTFVVALPLPGIHD